MKHGPRVNVLLIAVALAFLPAWTGSQAQVTASSSDAYGYFRTVEGRSLLSSREPEETRDLEINLPLLTGDAVQVGAGSRVEAVLADGSVVRLEAGTEAIFDQLARSPDAPTVDASRLVLLTGEIQLRVPQEAAEPNPLEIESNNARVYLIRGGSYWLGADRSDRTRLVVREGAAEVLTEDGSLLVQNGEEVEVVGLSRVQTRVARAGYERDIERWARDLERAAYTAELGPVEEPLRYSAASLARSGSWVRVDGRVAWRPRVRYGWRPFSDGYWVYTPSGLSWVALESWGWVTAHYGSWDYLPSYGWCWFPGYVYSPAWVYWYWGPSHAAWVPYGYYARHYGPTFGWRWGHHGYGLRFGVYGWASGGWSVFADWTFCPLAYFGRRGGRYYYRSGTELARERRALAVPRGIITTDTRGLDRAVWTRPYEARRRLGELHRGVFAKEPHRGTSDLPDVTSFVARRRDLPVNLQSVLKPVSVDDKRPALGRAVQGAKPMGDASTTFGDRGKPALGPTATRRPGTDSVVGQRQTVTAAPRFERKPLERPTSFERAPSVAYSSPGAVGKAPAARPPTPRAHGPRSGALERPTAQRRPPTSIYTKPGWTDRGSSATARPAPPASAQAGGRIQERRPLDSAHRVDSSVYSRPSVGSRPPTAGTTPPGRYVAPAKPTVPARPPTTSTMPPARRVVESARSLPPASAPRVQSSSRPSSPRVQPSAPRSSSPRVQSSSPRPSSPRVQSSVSSRRSSASSRSSSGSASRKKDD